MTACMGGWCRIRAGCEHYNAADRREPSERLCGSVDGELRPVVVFIDEPEDDSAHFAEALARVEAARKLRQHPSRIRRMAELEGLSA